MNSLPSCITDQSSRPIDKGRAPRTGHCTQSKRKSQPETQVVSGLGSALRAPSIKQLRAQSRIAASAQLQFTLHELFEQQVAHHPKAKAVAWDEGELSYGELDARSNRLSNFLHDLGVGPGARVAIVLPRSPSFIVANLAVLKIGGSCVPITPSKDEGAALTEHFEKTQQSNLARLALNCVITLDEHSGLFEHTAPTCVVLDVQSPQIDRCSDKRRRPCVISSALAYIVDAHRRERHDVAVALSHANLARLFYAATCSYLHPHPHDIWSWTHAAGDDRSLWEIWGALLHGGMLVIVPTPGPCCPRILSQHIVTHRINILCLQADHFMQLVGSGLCGPDLYRTLREVIVSDAMVDPATLVEWFEHIGSNGPRLSAAWGTPETSVYATIRPVTRADEHFSAVRLSSPLPDLYYYIVDDDLTPAPAGAQGELLIGGPGLARGYIGNPSLTSARFIPNTLSRVPGDCLFRSHMRVYPVSAETPMWTLVPTEHHSTGQGAIANNGAEALDSIGTNHLMARHRNGIERQTNKLRSK